MFDGLTANIIFASANLSLFLPSGISHRLYSGLILQKYRKASEIMSEVSGSRPSSVLILLGMPCTKYLTHFSLSSAWHAPKTIVSLSLWSSHRVIVVSGTTINKIPDFTCAAFPTTTLCGRTEFACFCNKNGCWLRCGEFSPSRNINQRSGRISFIGWARDSFSTGVFADFEARLAHNWAGGFGGKFCLWTGRGDSSLYKDRKSVV